MKAEAVVLNQRAAIHVVPSFMMNSQLFGGDKSRINEIGFVTIN